MLLRASTVAQRPTPTKRNEKNYLSINEESKEKPNKICCCFLSKKNLDSSQEFSAPAHFINSPADEKMEEQRQASSSIPIKKRFVTKETKEEVIKICQEFLTEYSNFKENDSKLETSIASSSLVKELIARNQENMDDSLSKLLEIGLFQEEHLKMGREIQALHVQETLNILGSRASLFVCSSKMSVSFDSGTCLKRNKSFHLPPSSPSSPPSAWF